MNILFFGFKFPPDVGGMQNSNYEIVKAIQSIGHNITVLTSDNNESLSFDKKQEFNIIRIKNLFPEKLSSNNYLILIYYYLKTLLYLKKELYKINPDKIIVSDSISRKIYGLFYDVFRIKPIVITSVPQIKSKRNKIIKYIRNKSLKKLYVNAEHIICVSKSTKKVLMNIYDRELFNKCSILYRTIDDKFIYNNPDPIEINKIKNQYSISEKEIIILTVSRLEKEKGIDNVIKAIINLDSSTIKYLIVGDGKDKDRLQKIIDNNNLNDKVILTGKIPHEEVINYYDLCDLFILTSRRGYSESFGRVFAEAGARSKPVIANNTGGAREVILNHKTGLLVNPNNINKIREKLEFLVKNKEKRKKYGFDASKRVKNMFTSNNLVQSLKKIL